MIVKYNLTAMNSDRMLNLTTNVKEKSTEKLSSGYKINRAADDAAGLSISEKMRRQVRGLTQASANAQDGISLLQVADGALEEVHAMLQRFNELAVKAGNDTNTQDDRSYIQEEINNLMSEVDRVADTTAFNHLLLLDGSKAGAPSASTGASPLEAAKDGLVQESVFTFDSTSVEGAVVTYPVKFDPVTDAQEAKLNPVLQGQIVPRAVNALLSTIPAFQAARNQISEGIGLALKSEGGDVLAFVGMSYSYDGNNKILETKLNLTVNVAKLELDSSNQLTADGRRKLETTIVHEMMHAFMDDTLTNGMIGADKGVLDASNQFPLWFVEGMAQTVAGGCSNDNDWVNGGGGLGIATAPNNAQISAAINADKNKLSSGTSAANYGTGYLACMYLGQLASGTTVVNAANLRNGVNKIMEKLIAGSSLNDVIKDVSHGKYGNIAQFEGGFGSDNDAITFIGNLVRAAGSNGNGSILVDPIDVVGANRGLANHDLLDNSAGTTSNSGGYAVNTVVEFVTSSANGTRNWNTGGAKSGSTGGTTGGGGTGTGGGIGGGGGGTGTGGGTGGTGGTGGVGGTGGGGNVIFVQVGADSGQHISVAIDDCHAKAIGLVDISVMSREEAGDAIDKVKAAIQKISENRSRIGAGVNRLEHTIKNLDNITENTQAAEGAIRDTDVAEEMVRFSNANILEQAGASVLSQANQSNSLMLSLLQ